MSIEERVGFVFKVRKDLNDKRCSWAKKRLRSFRTLGLFAVPESIDMQVLMDLKSQEVVSSFAVRAQAIPNYRHDGPSRLWHGEGQALALRARGTFFNTMTCASLPN